MGSERVSIKSSLEQPSMLDDTHKNGDELTAIFVTILKTAKQP